MEHFRGDKYLALPEGLKRATWQMREKPTRAEKVLWEEIRSKRLDGMRFRQQHVIGNYIADFYCHEANLVIEVDGNIHDFRKMEDQARDLYMKSLGLTVIRFSNDEVLHRLEKVKAAIRSAFLAAAKG